MVSTDNKRRIISIFAATIITLFIWHNLLASGNNIIFVFIFGLSYFATEITLKKAKKRSTLIAISIAILFSIIETVCKSINTDFTLNNLINKWLIINMLGYFFMAWIAIEWVYNAIEKNNLENYTMKKLDNRLFSNKVIAFIVCMLLILIAWTPYLLRYYPGIVTSDSCSQIEQSIGILELSDHHPIVHTAIISLFINLGLMISSNINLGIALYSIASMIIMAILDTVTLFYLRKKNVPKIVIAIVMLYYMFYPVNAIYSITMWKDVIFSGIVPIFIILCIELITNTKEFLDNKKNSIIFIVITLLMIYLRHNGFYAVWLSLPFIFIITFKEYWKKVLPIFVAVLVINILANLIIYNVLNIKKGSVVEMLSIPAQQIARVEKEHRDELDDDVVQEINHFFSRQHIGNEYIPTLSDPVKWSIDVDYYSENKIEFIKLWFNLLLKYPKEYVESFISNSYGYYYIEAKDWVVSTATLDRNLGIKQQPKIEWKLVDELTKLTERRDIPIISMLFSIGTSFWLTVICLGYKIYKKEYKYILIYLPIFILWLTLVASPAFCEFRYAYPILMTLPVFISMNLVKKEN